MSSFIPKILKTKVHDLVESRKVDLPTDIPRDPQKFYQDFGLFTHFKKDKNNQRLKVKKLTPYQIAHWKADSHVLHIKSNKIGLTTSALLEDFQRAILPEGRGGEIIVGAQDQDFANQHIMDLKMMIKFSKKYHNYLIERPDKKYLREMQSKVSVAYIANPDGGRPTVIVGVGQNPARSYSWKRIVHVHLSDISLIGRHDWADYWKGIYSRVSQTRGHIKIESIPKGQQGLVWNLHNRIHKENSELPFFKYLETNYAQAVKYDAMPQQTINEARQVLSKMEFESTYNCKFNPPGNQWYDPAWFTAGDYGIT